MLPIATEILTITEQNPGEFVSVVNDEFFAARKIRNPNEYLRSMLTLGRNQLIQEIAVSDREQKVDTAVHKSFKSSVFSASFLLDADMNFIMLTYFGEKTDPNSSYIEAMMNAMRAIDAIENSLDSSKSPTSSKKFNSPQISRGHNA